MVNPWPRVIGQTLGWLLCSALLGWAIGQTTLVLLGAALGMLGWHLLHLYHLECRLRDSSISQSVGFQSVHTGSVWWQVYRQVFTLQRRSRKRKRKLSRMIKQFRAAAAALPDALVVLDEQDKILWFNKASEHLLGLRSSQDINLPIATLLRHPSFLAFLNRGNYENSVEFPSPPNTELMLSVRIIPYRRKQRLLLAADVTRVHRLEQMRRDFVANVSHELRSPLTVINGYLETLLDSNDSMADQWQQPLLRMQQQSSRMLHLIEDLLMLSKLETQSERPPQRPVNVPAMLDGIIEDAIALSGERSHAIAIDADPQLWISGCEQQLRSAFSNLVFNAVRYTPDQGHIAVRWFADDRGVHLEVKDDGEGIPPQHIPRITERFYRLDRGRQRERGGTGLGLAIVKHVMNNHDGQLRITSQVSVGSVFSCDFPPQRLAHRQDKKRPVALGVN